MSLVDNNGEEALLAPLISDMSEDGNIRENSREIQDAEDPTEPLFVDHFSLETTSSTVRFRNSSIRVYEQRCDQILLEDHGPSSTDPTETGHTVTVKRMPRGSMGLSFLRILYTLVAMLVVSFMFIFCFALMLFLFLGGAPDANPMYFIGAILSVPIFTFGTANIMAMGIAFVHDTWDGHRLFQKLTSWSIVAVEWLCFVVFLGIPSATLACTLVSGVDNWWEITALVWVILVFLYFLLFFIAAGYKEISSCFQLMRIIHGDDKGWLTLARHAVMMRERHHYSGFQEERFLVKGNEEAPAEGYALSADHEPVKTNKSAYSWLTQRAFCSKLFEELDPPVRAYTGDEIRDIMPFVTAETWSLDKMCCSRSDREVTVVSGPSALRPDQFTSSIVCLTLGLALAGFVILAALKWFALLSSGIIVMIACGFVFFLILYFMRLVKLYRDMRHELGRKADGYDDETATADNDSQSNHTTAIHICETVQVTKPRLWLCRTLFSISTIFLFIWPLVTLFVCSWRVALVFLFLGGLSFARKFLNPSVALASLGSLSKIDFPLRSTKAETNSNTRLSRTISLLSKQKVETERARALRIKAGISNVTGHNENVRCWSWFFGAVAFVIFVMVFAAYGQEGTPLYENADTKQIVDSGGLLSDFYYPEKADLRYPTCSVTKGFDYDPARVELADFAFLSVVAYASPEESEVLLNQWFGEGSAVDQHDFVQGYRKEKKTDTNPLSYKLVTFKETPQHAILTIRGSETMWDWLFDVKAYFAAGLAQVLLGIIPFGWVWKPVLARLVKAVNVLESGSLADTAYYKLTTQFVQDMLNEGYNGTTFESITFTGTSLGGAIAIISGAQTKQKAVAISGVNAMLSRLTFDPPLEKEDINSYTFNVIPERDIIGSLGGRGRLIEDIECHAPMNSLGGCHSMYRTLCEIQNKCGSRNRPVLCRCNQMYGYPEPEMSGNRTFAQACPSEK